jgi:hypothetical protein
MVTQAIDIELVPYAELQSIDTDYHSHLQPEPKRAGEVRTSSSDV